MNRQQQRVIEYLVGENRVLREQLDVHAKGKRPAKMANTTLDVLLEEAPGEA